MACDPNELVSLARCFTCLPPGLLSPLQTYLLCQLVEMAQSGGLSSNQVLVYTTTDPTTDGIFPTDQTKGAIAYKLGGTGSTFYWNTSTLAWD
jgi:hypothetical protein